MAATTRLRNGLLGYGYWLLVGTLLGTGIVGRLSVGVLLAPVSVLLIFLGLRRPDLRNISIVMMLPGLALVALVLAWLNRGDAGTTCAETTTVSQCAERWSQWPFALVGLILILSAVLVLWLARARRRGRPLPPR